MLYTHTESKIKLDKKDEMSKHEEVEENILLHAWKGRHDTPGIKGTTQKFQKRSVLLCGKD